MLAHDQRPRHQEEATRARALLGHHVAREAGPLVVRRQQRRAELRPAGADGLGKEVGKAQGLWFFSGFGVNLLIGGFAFQVNKIFLNGPSPASFCPFKQQF